MNAESKPGARAVSRLTIPHSSFRISHSSAYNSLPVSEYDELTGLHRLPRFVVRQRQRGDDRHPVVRRRNAAEVDGYVLIDQVSFGERGAAHQVAQRVGAIREQVFPIGEQVIEAP